MTTQTSAALVRAQYENLPYPPRDPQDEARRLVSTWLDDLPMINHYGCRGLQDFRNGYRVLVAGGGTGDGSIFLAEQLRETNAEILHVDVSEASIQIARERARVRRLENLQFVHRSIDTLTEEDFGQFDYINCSGVLHHLSNPDDGLKALLRLMKPAGVLGLMVYATYGRTGVYQMQSLLGMLSGTENDAVKLAVAREVLASAPRSNWFLRGEELHNDHKNMGDAGLYDLLLHPQDRAYTVSELYEWLEDEHGMHIELTDVGRGRAPYLPRLVVGPHSPSFLELAALKPLRQQYEIAELLSGNIITHSLYATRQPSVSPYRDVNYVPFFFHEPITGHDLWRMMEGARGRPFLVNHAHTGVSISVASGSFGAHVAKYIDGSRAWAEIFELVRADRNLSIEALSDDMLFTDFEPMYDVLSSIDRLLLRHRSVAHL